MATHHGFLREFPFIRIDAFDGDPASVNPYTGKAPLFYLLTHAHTDHIVGLDSPNFSGQIYCTPLTKQLLLETMTAADRVREEELGKHVGRKRKFANLRQARNAKGAGGRGTGMDRIIAINYNTPTVISGPGGTSVTVTALDANHCPGSAMYLISGPSTTSTSSFFPSHPNQATSSSSSSPARDSTLLHTGDLRVESWWLTSLVKNPLLQPFLAPPPHPLTSGKGKGRASEEDVVRWERERLGSWGGGKTLDCIYLDTSAVMVDEELVEKDEAISSLIDLISQYPPDTRFFLNAWTWGYEEMLKGIYRAFGQEIHLDRYKERIYTSPPFAQFDPLLSTLGTTSSFPSRPPAPSPSLCASTTYAHPIGTGSREKTTPPLRFHACERRWRCDHAWAGGVGCYQWEAEHLPLLEGKKKKKVALALSSTGREEGEPLVVFVNPSEMPRWRWEAYREDVQRRLKRWNLANRDEGSEEVRTESSGSGGNGEGKKRLREADGEDEGEEPRLPTSLIVPLARHSSRPELQRLVSLFRPRTVYPLTLTPPTSASDPHAGWDYQQLPSIFGPHLALFGEAQLEREAKEYRKTLGLRRRRSTVLPPSSADVEDEGGLKEPKEDWMEEMRKLGMNVEGGPEAFREIVNWRKTLKPGESTPSPRGKKRKRRDEEDEVLVVDTEDEDSFPQARPASKKEKKTMETFDDSRRAAELARLPSPFLAAASSSFSALLPPAPIDSPPTTAAVTPAVLAQSAIVVETQQPLKSALSSSSRHARERECTPEATVIPPTATTSTGRALRKSVTFAASPSPRYSRQSRSASVGKGGATSVSSPELGMPPPLPSLLRPVPSASFNPLFSSSTTSANILSPPLRPFSTSTSSTSSSFASPALPAPTALSPPTCAIAKNPPAAPSPSTSGKPPPPRPPSSPTTRARRLATVAAIQRSMRGVIEGGRIVLFKEGDPRLQGKRALRVKVDKGKRREETPTRQALRETQEQAVQTARLVPSPSSFRTVEASTSP